MTRTPSLALQRHHPLCDAILQMRMCWCAQGWFDADLTLPKTPQLCWWTGASGRLPPPATLSIGHRNAASAQARRGGDARLRRQKKSAQQQNKANTKTATREALTALLRDGEVCCACICARVLTCSCVCVCLRTTWLIASACCMAAVLRSHLSIPVQVSTGHL